MKPTPTNLRGLSMLRDLIAFDTADRRGHLALVEWVRDLLKQMGAQAFLRHDGESGHVCLVATLGEGYLPGLVFAGRTRLAPVAGHAWASPPLRAELREGRVYGHGGADMKGFIACVLAAVPAMLNAADRAPFHLMLSHDERTLGRTLRALAGERATAGCILGKPTGMRVGRRPACEPSPLDRRISHLLGAGPASGFAAGADPLGPLDAQRTGLPLAVCGPGFADQAGAPDEYVALEQLVACNEFLLALIATQAIQPLEAAFLLAEALD